MCSRDVSVAYGGMKEHEQTTVHASACRSVSSTTSLTSYFSPSSSGPERAIATVEAEIKFAYFIGEHHLALALADHCSQLIPSLFPDAQAWTY